MGVYIKNMEMPTCCAGCIVACDAKSRTGFIRPFAERLPDCPLVPVPDHGRLIDADALTERLGDVEYKGAIKRVLIQSPTIIPADKEEQA